MHLIIFSCVGVSAGFLLYADCRLLLILRIRQRRIFIKHTVPRRFVTDLQGVFTAIAHLSILFNRFGVFAILECFILQPTFLIIIYLDKTVIYPRFSVQLDLISLEIFVIKCPFNYITRFKRILFVIILRRLHLKFFVEYCQTRWPLFRQHWFFQLWKNYELFFIGLWVFMNWNEALPNNITFLQNLIVVILRSCVNHI